MAYAVTYISLVETWTAASYAADDGSLDIDVTTCMTNGTTGEDCDEWKEGTLNVRMEVNIPPSAVTSLGVRFYLNDAMTPGDNSLMPYTDANSVSSTNQDIQDYTTPGWITHATGASFLAELGDLGDKFALRLASNDGAKSKIGEVQIDIAFDQDALTGISKDNSGSVLVSCKMACFKVISEGPPETYEWIQSVTSDGSTGAYSFDVWAGNTYMVYGEKDDTPHVFDCTDNVLEADV